MQFFGQNSYLLICFQRILQTNVDFCSRCNWSFPQTIPLICTYDSIFSLPSRDSAFSAKSGKGPSWNEYSALFQNWCLRTFLSPRKAIPWYNTINFSWGLLFLSLSGSELAARKSGFLRGLMTLLPKELLYSLTRLQPANTALAAWRRICCWPCSCPSIWDVQGFVQI